MEPEAIARQRSRGQALDHGDLLERDALLREEIARGLHAVGAEGDVIQRAGAGARALVEEGRQVHQRLPVGVEPVAVEGHDGARARRELQQPRV